MKTMYDFYTLSLSHIFSIGIVETDTLLEYKQCGNWKIKEGSQILLDKYKLELLRMYKYNSRKYRFIRKIGKAKIINNHKVLPYTERKAL